MNMTFRFATPEDAPAFAAWAAGNPQIAEKDTLAAMKENNPTATVLVVEEEMPDGAKVARFFMPVYLAMRVAFCGFNPENTREQNLAALETMLPYLKAFAETWFVREVDVLTKKEIPIAQWAEAHGFTAEDRQLYTLKVKGS